MVLPRLLQRIVKGGDGGRGEGGGAEKKRGGERGSEKGTRGRIKE